MRTLLRASGREDGSILFLMAAGLAAFASMVGVGIDLGQAYVARGDLQKLADASALAAGQELPDTAAGTAMALDFIADHGGADTTGTVALETTIAANDTLHVTATRHVSFWFMQILGLEGVDLEANATVRVGSYTGGTGILPIAFTTTAAPHNALPSNSCYLGQSGGIPNLRANTVCRIRYGSGFGGATGSGAGGEFGALALDAPGSTEYKKNLAFGASTAYEAGDAVAVLTGNMGSETDDGFDDRLDRPAPAGCGGHSRSAVVRENANGTLSIRPGCEASPRIGVIPVVDAIDPTGNTTSTIYGFVFVFIHRQVWVSGGHEALEVEFVTYVTAIAGAEYGDGDGSTAVKLVD